MCERYGVADRLKHAPPHVCYHAEFGRYTSNCIRINRGELLKVGSAGVMHTLGLRAWLTSRNTTLLTCYLAERGGSALKVEVTAPGASLPAVNSCTDINLLTYLLTYLLKVAVVSR